MQKNFTRLLLDVTLRRFHYHVALLSFLLLFVSQLAVGQTWPYINSFSDNSGVTSQFTANKGSAAVSGGVLIAQGGAGNNKGIQGYIVINTGRIAYSGSTYTVSVKARLSNFGGNKTSDENTKFEITRGIDVSGARAATGNRLLESATRNLTNTGVQTFEAPTKITGDDQPIFIGFFVENLVTNVSNLQIIFDDLTITQTCNNFPTAPTTDSAERCGSGAVILSAAGAPNGGSYRWYTSDAPSATPILGATGNTYNTPLLTKTTVYYVSTVRASGCESTTRTPVTATIKTLPSASIFTTLPTQCKNTGNNFFPLTGTIDGATSYTWEIVGDNTLNATLTNTDTQTPTVTVPSAGTVTVRLTAISGSGCGTASSDIVLTVQALPAAPVVPNNERCGPGVINLVASGAPAGGTYKWYNEANELQFTGANYSPDLDVSTTYYVSSVSASPQSCESIDRTPVLARIKVLPAAKIIPITPVCESNGGSSVFPLNSDPDVTENGTSYLWEVIDDNGTALPNATITNPTSLDGAILNMTGNGTLTVRFTVSNSNGCPSAVDEVPVTVAALPTQPTAPSIERCGAGDVVLEATAGAPTDGTYNWYAEVNDEFPIFTGTTYNINIPDDEDFFVASVNELGCESTTRTQVNAVVNDPIIPTGEVYANGQPMDENTATPLEVGETATFSVEESNVKDSDGVALYQWYLTTTSQGRKQVGTNSPSVDIVMPDDFVELVVDVTFKETACFTATSQQLVAGAVAPFPVEIIYMNANKQGNNVVLEWATAMEQDNTGFEVQVSSDGFNFRKLVFVPSKNGNTSTKQVYTFTDKENGKHGTRYYRLKQLDANGAFEFFGPKVVTFGAVASKVIAFPNPFNDEITLDIASEKDGVALIVVTDAVGKKLLERKVQIAKGFTTEKLKLPTTLPKGLYIIRADIAGVTQHIKMVKE